MSGIPYTAEGAEKPCKEEFVCPECQAPLVLKKGTRNVHHFSHKVVEDCHHGEGKGPQHTRAQFDLYTYLLKQPELTNVKLEHPIDGRYADVYFEVGTRRVVVEFQESNISIENITARTKDYHESGVYVLWVAIINHKIKSDRQCKCVITPPPWVEWISKVDYGRVVTYAHLKLRKGEFKLIKFKTATTWCPATSWFDSGGAKHDSVGHDKYLKRRKFVIDVGTFSLLHDFDFRLRRTSAGSEIPTHKTLLLSNGATNRQRRPLLKLKQRL